MSKAAGDRKYRRQEKARADHAQAIFTPDGQGIKVRPHTIIKHVTANLNRIVFCPFCLKSGPLRGFLVSTKKGISQHKAFCQNCGTSMLMRSVTRSWTATSYADWVFDYARSGFWQKINFKAWSAELEIKGWTREFWDRYKLLKGPDEYEEEY